MKAAVVEQIGSEPNFSDFREPIPDKNQHLVCVQASAISQITKARASATHYSADHAVPFIPGFDGVGTLEDGSRVYFLVPHHPYGAMAEYCVVPKKNCLVLSSPLDASFIAATAIPGMSSWAALVDQARMVPDDTVLINGAGGVSGRLAIQVAKFHQAKKIIATARREELFDELYALGATQCILLKDDSKEMEQSFNTLFREGVHIVLDYLWGPSALTLIQSAAKHSPSGWNIQFVQIGSIAGVTIPFPAAALRSSGLRIMGSGLGSLTIPQMLNAISQFIEHVPQGGFFTKTREFPLRDVSHLWNTTHSESRTVLMI
jgi:NADPH:quinone reductase-like Zn-dependent oxidoreductase